MIKEQFNQAIPETVSRPEKNWSVETVAFAQYQDEITAVVEACNLSSDCLAAGEVWLIVKNEAKVVACVTFESRGDLIHLQSLAVIKEMRRKGLAKQLVENVYQNYLKPGQTLIAMTLVWNNKIYRAMGFERLDASLKQLDDVGQREKHKYCTVWGKKRAG